MSDKKIPNAGDAPKQYKDTYGREFNIPNFTMKEVHDAIPPHCFERSLVTSYGYVVRDLVIVFTLFYCATFISYIPSLPLRILAWAVYGVLQGLISTGVWVLAHECGHGAFSPYNLVNDVTGWVLHSALLVPYFSWKFSHSTHHKTTGHIDRDMVFKPTVKNQFIEMSEETPIVTLFKVFRQQIGGWPAYLVSNVSGQKYPKAAPNTVNHFHPDSPLFKPSQRREIILSDIGIAITLSALIYATKQFGFASVMLYYGMPYLWVNHWLVAITYLQHTDPALPHYRGEEWNFQRGASATIDRDFGFIGREVFHGIIETHVCHHLISRIPFYHADEATVAIKKVLGPHYQYDGTNFFVALWRSARMCQYLKPKEMSSSLRIRMDLRVQNTFQRLKK